jgi:UPF0755 protein
MRSVRRIIIGVAGGVAIGVLWFVLQLFPVGGSGKLVIVTVHPGDSLATIASELHSSGVIASPLAFRVDAIIEGGLIVQPGSYQIGEGSSFSHIRSIIGQAPNVSVVYVTPGLTIREIAVDIAGVAGNHFASQFLQAVGSQTAAPWGGVNSLEGLIGAGQYIITPQTTPSSLLTRMRNRFDEFAVKNGLYSTGDYHGLTPYQLITAASIVEKEGYYPSNMPKVARVILNRLARHGSLQMDATVLYALGLDGGKVTPSMLRTATPYNTYLHVGLTPTPICVVSSYAMKAMLHPPMGSWLYFVVIDKAGDEAFSSTFAGQLANERLAQERGL